MQSITPDSDWEISSSNSLLDSVLQPVADNAVRQHVFKSLARIERHLLKRNPEALHHIYQSYASKLSHLDTNQNAEAGPTRFLLPPPPPPSVLQQQQQQQQLRRLNFKQRRMEQDQINLKLVDHIKIPEGVAIRGLLVPTPPDFLFSDDCPDWLEEVPDNSGGFQWLETNVSNAEECSRRAMSRELVKQSLEDWVFLYFRVQKRNWESTVVEEKKNAPDVNMYAEDQVHKWTLKLRYKMLRMAPMKVALLAFLSRMGLESDPNIVFCRDGFYGLMDVGNVYGELNKTPCSQLSFNSTPKYLSLKNGDSIFVNSCTSSQRQIMEDAPRQDAPKRGKHGSDSDSEEGEFEYIEEGEDDE